MLVLLVILLIFLCLQLIAWGYLLGSPSPTPRPLTHFPTISILVAARNEATNIRDCLEALEKLNYPKEKLQILIGDDASSDQTAAIVQAFIKNKPHFQLHFIQKQLGQAIGKANVLAHLAHQAKGDWFFFTDADVVVPSTWIESMLGSIQQKPYSIIMGFTSMLGQKPFSRLQAIDWCFALGLIHLFMRQGLPITTMGNNMVFKREAYWSTGGYEKLAPSIVEDFTLFQAAVKRGARFIHIVHPSITAYTQPMPSFLALLQQRKRWMRGALRLPWYMVIYLWLQATFFPFILALLFVHPLVGITICSIKIFLQSLFISLLLQRIRHPQPWYYLILYEFYIGFLSVTLVIYYVLPIRIQWKGRTYR
ncbi:MAG: glycosyltransferase [Thermonemataceae bacterium]